MNKKLYIIGGIVLSVLHALDTLLTKAGLNLGQKEGNPIYVYMFNLIGIDLTFLIGGIFYFILLWIAIYLMCNQINHKNNLYNYTIMWIVISVKVFAIGGWIGMINILI